MSDAITRKKNYKLISLMYAYTLCITFLNLPISVFFHTGGMVFNICVVLALAALNIRGMLDFKIRVNTLFYILFLLEIYIVTNAVTETLIPRKEFYFYFMLASLIGTYRCDYEKVLRYIMYISLLIIPCAPVVFGNVSATGLGGFLAMGTSFALIPGFMAGVIHFFFFRRKGKPFDKFCYIVDVIFLFLLIIRGNRNMVLTTLITVFCLYLKGWGSNKKRKKITFKLLLVFILVIIIFVNFYSLLEWVDNVLKTFDIEARFIQKTIQMRDRGDVTNGRAKIMSYTWQEIKKSPIWGHGVSTIYHNSGNRIIYPHNFLLQLLYDGGILLAIPTLYILWKTIHYAFKGENRAASAFLLYLLLICIPKMSLSSDLWKNHAFWIMLIHTLQYYIKKPEPVKEETDDSAILSDATSS